MEGWIAFEPLELLLFATGWAAGWLLLWRPRLLPAASPTRSAVAVVIPARNESAAIAELTERIGAQLKPADELVVVDDHSGDDTGVLAHAAGAQVIVPPTLPSGWLGKPHACCAGAAATTAPVLLFVDADVEPSDDLVDRIACAVDNDQRRVVSVQPWHRTERAVEQFSLLANTVALMGSGACTPWSRGTSSVAFGPVLAVDRTVYDEIGGHAAPTVRASPVEDIEIARQVGAATVYCGEPRISFRMYPEGGRQLLLGWSRTIAAGMRSTPPWTAVFVAAWIWSLAGGWIAQPLTYPLSALQVWVLGRRAGALHPVAALLYPVLVVGFLVIVARAVAIRVSGRSTPWKGRQINVR